MKNIKYVGIGTVVYLGMFVADYIYELFQINSSGTVETIFGLRMVTNITDTELSTIFSLTPKMILIYIVFIVMWVLMANILNNRDKKSSEWVK